MNRGIKQSWLAKESGLREPLISKIARKKTVPDVYQARRIVNALRQISSDVTIDDLWPLSEEEND